MGLIFLHDGQVLLRDYGIAAALSTIIGFVLMVSPNRFFRTMGMVVVGGWVATILQLGVAGYFAYSGWWGATAVAVLAAVGLLSFIVPMMLLWNIGSGGLHPKYRLAKRMYGLTFPFERSPS